jgi:hypothetical protein
LASLPSLCIISPPRNGGGLVRTRPNSAKTAKGEAWHTFFWGPCQVPSTRLGAPPGSPTRQVGRHSSRVARPGGGGSEGSIGSATPAQEGGVTGCAACWAHRSSQRHQRAARLHHARIPNPDTRADGAMPLSEKRCEPSCPGNQKRLKLKV